jgi:RNA-directed DNA polymerase
VARLKRRVNGLLHRGNQAPWPQVREDLNCVLRGWSAYFNQGTRLMAYRAVDNHVCHRVRRFLVRRHKVPSRGTKRFAADAVSRDYGVLSLRTVHLGPPPCALR